MNTAIGAPSRLARVLRHRRPWTVREGPGAGLRLGQDFASADYRSGRNEPAVQEALLAHLPDGGVFYDVGCNIGFFSLLAARATGRRGRVYALEAVPEIAARVIVNAELNGLTNIHVLCVAAGAGPGIERLWLASHPGGATLASAGRPPDATTHRLVPVLPLDDLTETDGVRPPDVVKVDVEGAELAVVLGLRRTLRRHSPVLLVEVDAATVNELETRIGEVSRVLAGERYETMTLARAYPDDGWHVRHLVARAIRQDRSAEAVDRRGSTAAP